MNLPRIYERLYCSPLSLTVERLQSLHAAVFPRLMGKGDLGLEAIAASALDGGGGPRPQRSALDDRGKRPKACWPDSGGCLYYEAKPGVAVVPVSGVLAKGLSNFEESCGGGTDIDPVARAFSQARHSAAIEAIILDGDSPGGEVTGISELAGEVRAAARVKPVYGWTDTGAYSACYQILSGASEIYATPSAGIGSIGTRAGWLDTTIAHEMAGLEYHSFEGGKHKGAGLPFRGMTDEEKSMLQAKVDHFYSQFKADVRAGRGAVADSTMQGQTFIAEQALDLNLINGLFSSWAEFVAFV